MEQITARAATDAERFYQDPDRPGEQMARPGNGRTGLPPLAISADGKGVAMRPEASRRRGPTPVKRVRNFAQRTGTGEKDGHKRMAETGCVFDVQPPALPRTPEQVMHPEPGSGKNAPRAVNRWYTSDITAGRDVTIGKIFDEADRRDPGHRRTWIALVDGDIYQLGLIQDQAAPRGITVTILADFIHVLEYLWKAAWCFHAPRDPAMEDWVITQAQDILHGRTPTVITRIRQLAADAPAQARRRAREDHPQDRALPGRQAALPRLPALPWPAAGRSPPASSKAPAATWSKTAWASCHIEHVPRRLASPGTSARRDLVAARLVKGRGDGVVRQPALAGDGHA